MLSANVVRIATDARAVTSSKTSVRQDVVISRVRRRHVKTFPSPLTAICQRFRLSLNCARDIRCTLGAAAHSTKVQLKGRDVDGVE